MPEKTGHKNRLKSAMKKNTVGRRNLNREGERLYEQWSRKFETDPKLKSIYAEESAKMDLWMQLAEQKRRRG